MQAESGHLSDRTWSWSAEAWGGLAAMLVALPSAVAFGMLVYAPFGPDYVGQGALAGVVGAAALGLVAPLIGRNGGLISAPCAPAAAVLSALAADLVSGNTGGIEPSSLPALLALTVMLSSVLQVLYGAIGGGRLIKFIPYPVVSGYMSGVGALIAISQLPKLLGLPPGTPLVQGVTSPALWQWQGLLAGMVTIAAMWVGPRITTKTPPAILGLLAGIVVYLVLALFSPGLRTLEGNTLVIGPLLATGSFLDAAAERAASFFTFDPAALRHVLIPALTLSALLSIDTLKTCVVLDALTRSRHNSNRELIGQGFGNAVACLAGGMPGAGTVGPTLVNVTSGGRTPRSGVIEGALTVVAFLLIGNLIAWLPVAALAGILLLVAWRMVDKSMLRLLRYPGGRLDFAVIAGVIVVAVTVDLIAAAGVGVILAIVLFIRDQMRGSVIRRKRYLSEVSSKTRRLAAERELLAQHGGQGVFCELQGNLFFGTTDQLFSQLEQDLRRRKYILFDMRRVQSLDFTAAHLLYQMQAQLAERGGRLLFSGMPSTVLDRRHFEHDLARAGVLRKEGGAMVFETLDAALEWMEEQILESAAPGRPNEEPLLQLRDIDLFRGLDESAMHVLGACARELSIPPGEKVFAQGDTGDELYLVRRGSVRILLPLEGGKRHHVATFGHGDFFGELSFLDRGLRSADAEAKAATELYVLPRARFDAEVQRSAAAFSGQFFARLALVIAKRMRQTDIELQALEER